jgi:hypothetical protein
MHFFEKFSSKYLHGIEKPPNFALAKATMLMPLPPRA